MKSKTMEKLLFSMFYVPLLLICFGMDILFFVSKIWSLFGVVVLVTAFFVYQAIGACLDIWKIK